MLVALISDLHGNLIALEAVLADLELERPDRAVCLGDVAATGPQPRETVERLRELGYPVVMGNADAELLRPIPDAEGEEARKIVEIYRWCAGRLSSDHLEYLRGFRPTLEVPLAPEHTLLCFHGSPRSFDEVIVAATPEDGLDEMLSGQEAAVVAGGARTRSSCAGVERRRSSTPAASASTRRGPSTRSSPSKEAAGGWRCAGCRRSSGDPT